MKFTSYTQILDILFALKRDVNHTSRIREGQHSHTRISDIIFSRISKQMFDARVRINIMRLDD